MNAYDLTWFFNLKHLDAQGVEVTEEALNRDVLSFAVEEEEMNALIVNLTIRDPLGHYNKLFRYGATVEVSWGIREPERGFFDLFGSDDVTGALVRGPMRMFVVNNSGTLANREATLNIALRVGRYGDRNKITRVFKTGTVATMLQKIAEELQCDLKLEFESASDAITLRNPYHQKEETNQSFLKRLSAKLNVKLVYQHDPRRFGRIQTIWMIDWDRERNVSLPKGRGGQGLFHYLNYGTSDANMLDGWKFDPNLSGGSFGSSVSAYTDPATGKASLRVAPAGTESTTAYVLDEKKIEAELRGRPPAERTKLLQEIMAADFEDFNAKGGLRDRYFRAETFTTAPEGPGWTMGGGVLPSIFYQVGDLVWMGPKEETSPTAIPPQYRTTNDRQVWRIKKQSLGITGGGVTQNLEVAR